MKRADELKPLSHEHHRALYAAMMLKRASKHDAAETRKTFIEFLEEEGGPHFRVEEEVLLPAWLAACGRDRSRAELAARVAAEHLEIRARARQLREWADGSLETLHGLGTLLESHVRFEEREVFPLIEAQMSREAMRALGAELARS